MWTGIRSAVMMPRSLAFIVLATAVYLWLLGKKWIGETNTATLLSLEWSALIAVMALLQLGLITVSDGLNDVIKHAFLFNLLFDYMLVAIAAMLLSYITKATPKAEGGIAE